MGLDMNLVGTVYLWGDDSKKKQEALQEIFPEFLGHEVSTVEFEVGYWRKANQIHKWFVDNVQDGKDDCGRYYVDAEKLLQLKEVCKTVLDDKERAEDLLPAQNGFFFGSTDYDDWYFKTLQQTIDIIDGALRLYDNKKISIAYTSSW